MNPPTKITQLAKVELLDYLLNETSGLKAIENPISVVNSHLHPNAILLCQIFAYFFR